MAIFRHSLGKLVPEYLHSVLIGATNDGGSGDNWSFSLHFNGHFPGEPGLAGVY